VIREVSDTEYKQGLVCDQCGLCFNEHEVAVEWRVFNGMLVFHGGCATNMSGRLFSHVRNATKDGKLVLSHGNTSRKYGNTSNEPRRAPSETRPTFITKQTVREVTT
jgi:hypothetical protein